MHPVEAEIGEHPQQGAGQPGQFDIQQPVVIGKGVYREGDQAGEQQLSGLIARPQHEIANGFTAIHQRGIVADFQELPQEHANKERRGHHEDQLPFVQGQPGRHGVPERGQAAVLPNAVEPVHQSHGQRSRCD